MQGNLSKSVAEVTTAGLQCSHVMAMSVQRLFPGTKVTIGPWIDRGFYYDFDIPQAISQDDLKTIKKEMQKIIKKKLPFTREEVHHHDFIQQNLS